MGAGAVVASETGAGEVARAAAEVGSAADVCPTEVSPAAEVPATSEGVATATEMAAATPTVALRESLPAGEQRGECGHGP